MTGTKISLPGRPSFLGGKPKPIKKPRPIVPYDGRSLSQRNRLETRCSKHSWIYPSPTATSHHLKNLVRSPGHFHHDPGCRRIFYQRHKSPAEKFIGHDDNALPFPSHARPRRRLRSPSPSSGSFPKLRSVPSSSPLHGQTQVALSES